MKVLVLNAGSSSLKFQVFNMHNEQVLASGLVEKIGEKLSTIKYQAHEKLLLDQVINNHQEALNQVAQLLTDPQKGVIKDKAEIKAVGHRIVHGGEAFSRPTSLTDSVLKKVEEMVALAPLHNPANLTGIYVAREIFPLAEQVGVFDTAFHQTMPAHAYRYALPNALYHDLHVRRYGFHGTSHSYVSKRAAEYLGKNFSQLTAITIHAGNGASMAAIKNGKSVDTTMGLTPLEGLVMGTRSGDLDPAIIQYLHQQKKWSLGEIIDLYNKQSGLKGLCGSNDLRDVWARVEQGDQAAQLAVEIYAYRIKKYIGAYLAILGKIDCLIFTAGVGENDYRMRELALTGLEHLGLIMDGQLNRHLQRSPVEKISQGAIPIFVIPTNEELEIAREVKGLLAR